MNKINAYVFRTEMIGGGTAYDVYFLTKDKPSRPISNGTYATIVCRDGKEFYRVVDAIDPKSRWNMECGIEKYEAFLKLEKEANKLAHEIASQAFPELRELGKLPFLWANWTLPSQMVKVPVEITLPE